MNPISMRNLVSNILTEVMTARPPQGQGSGSSTTTQENNASAEDGVMTDQMVNRLIQVIFF